jgi:GAF domain-containing protein
MSDSRQILAEAGRAFGATFDPVAAPWNVVAFLVPRLADWSLIGLLTADGAAIERLAHAHVDPARAAQLAQVGRIMPGRSGALARVLRSGRPFLVRDVSERANPLPRALSALGTRSLLAVPLHVSATRRPAGIIVLGAYEPGRFGLDETRLAVALALRASVVLDLARRYDAMQAQSAGAASVPKARRRQRLLAARAQRRAELAREWLGDP